MISTLHRRTAALIDTVAAEARARLGAAKSKVIERFIRAYYEHVPPHDIAEKGPENLYGAALAHWKFAARRAPGEAKVRVYNPRPEEHGWRADHSVAEIVNDDMPFLVDSVTAALNRLDLTVHLVIHPILRVRRDSNGALVEVVDGPGTGAAESFMHVEFAAQSGERLDEIGAAIATVLKDVRAAVDDYSAMRAALKAAAQELRTAGWLSAEDVAETTAFLEWLHDNHFTFLGLREYPVAAGVRTAVPGLGVLRDAAVAVLGGLGGGRELSPEVQEFVEKPDLLLVTKSNLRSTVHRPVHMDVIGVKRIGAEGKVAALLLFAGLFTSTAYSRSPRDIPLLRRKIRRVIDRAGFPPASHDGKALLHILEAFPRDELFQVSDDQLYETGLGILHLQERQRVALFLRRDPFDRFASCLIYVPRDRYTTALRLRMQRILEDAVGGETTAYYTQLDESPLARLHVIVGTTPGQVKAFDPPALEASLVAAARSWTDVLAEKLVAAKGEEQGLFLYRRYCDAFPSGYTERFAAETAVADIAHIEETLAGGEIGMNLNRPIEAADNQLWFKIYLPNRKIALSDVLPMLEHMGLRVVDEVPYAVRPAGAGVERVMLHDFGIETQGGRAVDLGAVRTAFQDAFRRVWRGEMESDGFNALVLYAGMTWREVVVLRTYCKYLRQAGVAFSQAYMEQTLSRHPGLARRLVDLFLALFDPGGGAGRDAELDRIRAEITERLDKVENADEDRILRRFLNAVESSLRTNYFQTGSDGAPKPYLAIKLDSRKVDELPLPRPLVEVFVYSPRVEAIHLRGGKVARGGIRWSDRREDFRTEILGLMKAQTVKNAVIVPVGAKGGFVVKRPPASGEREAVQEEGVACYRTLIRGLLDITDNRVGEGVAPPQDVVRRDDDDPYLVVAADKGTATFSDIANAISNQYGFWLGDAFASGGSNGYDHKKIAITARGAWVSVERHFRELGRDIANATFTVVGVGDMSGDVFGNGMLLSPRVKLIAAFDHRHILIDPDPDPARSLAERRRLFELPRSSWMDYDRKATSAGADVFDRRAKSVKLSAEARAVFGIEKATLTPSELIRTLLRAEVDLLWFGGIGTFVKASHETNAEVGDRGNDAVRVNAAELRCAVVGEGANLGVTQRGRVECALKGGRINADSIDNSGGVDCSDHEVNIKILLDALVAGGDMTEKQRNRLLVDMTDEVAQLVLRDNYLQTQAISLAVADAHRKFDYRIRLMRMLERIGRLNREVEALPDDETIAERVSMRKGFTRPEIAVLMSYAKIWLNDELLKSDLPDDPQLAVDLVRYFPTALQTRYRAAIARHRLRREIIATHVTNSMINRVGGSFITRLMEKTGMAPADIARAYIVARDVFAMRDVWSAIEALDGKVATDVQLAMLKDGNWLIERGTLWILRNAPRPIDIGANIAAFGDSVAALAKGLDGVLPAHYRADLEARAKGHIEGGVPGDLAHRVAGMVNLAAGLEIARLAQRHKASEIAVGELYFAVGAYFRMGRLRAAAERLEAANHWQQMAVAALIDDLYTNQGALTAQMLGGGVADGAKAMIDAWATKRGAEVENTRALIGEIWSAESIDFPMLSVASRRLQALL